jgi:hypothetical protein
MRWDLLPDLSAFDSARRREAYRRLSRAVRGLGRPRLLDLDEVRDRLGGSEETYEGIRAIPVSRIIGSAGREREFDRDFLPREDDVRERWRRVEQAFPQGDFPPIVVYEIDGHYFVVDGHHRVAVAKERGVEYIDAEVTRVRTRSPLPPDADPGELIAAQERRRFLEETALAASRPDLSFSFSDPRGYPELLELVKVHAFELSVERGAVVPLAEAAADWTDRVYAPTVELLRSEGIQELFPRSTDADLFLWAHQHRRALHLEGPGVGLGEVARRRTGRRRPRRSD